MCLFSDSAWNEVTNSLCSLREGLFFCGPVSPPVKSGVICDASEDASESIVSK